MKLLPPRASGGRPILLMIPGPIYLFWTTGVFYLWTLRAKFRIVLAVPESYREDINFARVADLVGIHEVAYYKVGGAISRHYLHASFFSKLIDRNRPTVLLVHSRSYLEDLYAIHYARLLDPGCWVLTYQNGRSPMQWEEFASAVKEADIRKIARRHELPFGLAAVIVSIYRWVAFTLNTQLLPRVVVGRAFSPFFNVHSLSPLPENAACLAPDEGRPIDFFLCYMWAEARNYRRLGFPNVAVVSHPASDVGADVLNTLFNCSSSGEMILVLPSYELETGLLLHDATTGQTADFLASRWIDALAVLRERMPAARLGMKIHPRADGDTVWQVVLARMLQAFPDMVVFDVNTPAAKLIVESSCVVSDVSTTLWWALNCGDKVVISLNIFGFRGGEEMQGYGGILYIDDLSTLASIGLNSARVDEVKPSALEFVSALLEKDAS